MNYTPAGNSKLTGCNDAESDLKSAVDHLVEIRRWIRRENWNKGWLVQYAKADQAVRAAAQRYLDSPSPTL